MFRMVGVTNSGLAELISTNLRAGAIMTQQIVSAGVGKNSPFQVQCGSKPIGAAPGTLGTAPIGTTDVLCRIAYFTAFTMSKIGRYMATMIPPTTTPKNTIMIGSNSDNNALTAASTSSS